MTSPTLGHVSEELRKLNKDREGATRGKDADLAAVQFSDGSGLTCLVDELLREPHGPGPWPHCWKHADEALAALTAKPPPTREEALEAAEELLEAEGVDWTGNAKHRLELIQEHLEAQ